MWVIIGPFKSSSEEEDAHKPKLLRPDHSYGLGRQEGQPLLINSKKLSKEHCNLTVGPHTVEDASDLDLKPTLEITNLTSIDKNKAVQVTRDSEPDIIVPPSTSGFLQDGDNARLVATVAVSVKWEVMNVYIPPELASTFSTSDCAGLGIKVVHTPESRVTHHITPDLTFTLPIAASLLSLANFATPDWLAEVIRLGQLPKGQGSLEDQFVLPALKSYQPSFAPNLPSQYKIRKVWVPKEERLNLFADLRFICFFEKVTRADSDLADAIHAGMGDMEKFDVTLGTQKFRRSLTRGQAKEGKKTVVIANIDAMELAVGKMQWQEYVAEASQFSLTILSPTKIIEAALESNTSVLLTPTTPSPAVSSSAPSSALTTPSTLDTAATSKAEAPASKEPSKVPIGRPSRPPQRTTGRAPSTEPSAPSTYIDPLDIVIPPPRRPLRRPTPMVTGLDDPSVVLNAPPQVPPPRRQTPPRTIEEILAAPTPARSSRLKRRVESTANMETNSTGLGETIREPPLKKFKALFESADPESQAMDGGAIETSQTQAESQTSQRRRPMGASTLEMLREEEEETPSTMASQIQRPLKRRVPSGSNPENENMIVDEQVESPIDEAMPPQKRRAVENVNAVEKVPEPTAPAKTGAPAGKPDTNQAFLKALASTKRGKKTEDEFDRDFNHLRISKPALEREHTSAEDELKVLADFGDDSGLRGNFMVVVEMDVPERRSRANQPTNCEWTGKPNFKKFKKKVSKAARPIIDLFVTDQDFGTGSAYWKKDDTSTQILDMSSNTFDPEPEDESQAVSAGPSEPKNSSGAMDSGDEDLFGSQAMRRTTRSRASSREPSVSTTLKTGTASSSKKPVSESSSRSRKASSSTTTAAKGKAASSSKTRTNGRSKKATPLFLDSDEDIEEEVDELQSTVPSQDVMELLDDDDEDETMKSTLSKTRTSRRAPSSRGGSVAPSAPKATGRKTSGTTRMKMAPIMVVDDSEDEGGFKGF